MLLLEEDGYLGYVDGLTLKRLYAPDLVCSKLLKFQNVANFDFNFFPNNNIIIEARV